MKRSVVVLLVVLAIPGFGQTRSTSPLAKNTLYVELIGNAVGISLNYEYLFAEYFSIRYGLGGHSCFCEDDYVVYAPVEGDFGGENYDPPPPATALLILMANFLTPKYPHHLELGGGLVYVVGDPRSFLDGSRDQHFVPAMTFLYRYQDYGGGFVFRLGATPIFTTKGMITSFGVSFGSSF